jgi:hypothetical protein
MSFKKFESGDILYNTIKAKPKYEFKIFNGKIILNNSNDGYIVLNSLNITPPVFTGCTTPYSLDFSCVENTYYLGII